MAQPVTDIPYDHSHDEQLGHPHICIIVQQHFELDVSVRLSEAISCCCQQCGKDSFLLSIDRRKQQYIQQIKIQSAKVLASGSQVVQYIEDKESDDIFQKGKQTFHGHLRTMPDPAAQAAPHILSLQEAVAVTLHKCRDLSHAFRIMGKDPLAVFILILSSVQYLAIHVAYGLIGKRYP